MTNKKGLKQYLFLLFLDNLAVVFSCLTLQDKHNIRTLSENIKFICKRLAFLPISKTKCCFNPFLFVSSVTSALLLFLILTVAQHGSGTRKTISWSLTVHNKHLYSEYNFTAQIEPVQDK
jgi:hypothetical protein